MERTGQTTSIELDAMTSRLLVHVAETWGVSEQEAIHRALEEANAKSDQPDKDTRLEALNELQRRLNLTPAKAAEWQETIREARR